MGEHLAKDDLFEVEGVVVAMHKGGLYRVQCDQGHEVLAQLSGQMRRFRIRVVQGDRRHGGRVTVRSDTRVHHLPHAVEESQPNILMPLNPGTRLGPYEAEDH